MTKLTYAQRKILRNASFALPKDRKYPIDTIARGRNALSRVSAHGTTAEKEKVRKAVYRRFPQLRP